MTLTTPAAPDAAVDGSPGTGLPPAGSAGDGDDLVAAASAGHHARMAWDADLFTDETDPDAVLARAAEALGRSIGVTRAFYGVIDAEGGTLDIVVDWTNGVPPMRGRFPLDVSLPPIQQVLDGGAEVVEDLDTADLPESLRAVHRGNHSLAWIAVPLIRGNRPVALVVVANNRPRTFDPADIELVRDVGERTWQAFVHANTVRRLRANQAAMDARAGHERFFRALGDAIRGDRDDVTILFKIATMLATHLGADSASFSEPDPADPMAHDVYHHLADPAPRRTAHRVVMPPGTAAYLTRLEGGQPIVARDVLADADADLRAFLAEARVRSHVGMPVVENGRVALLLSVQNAAPRDWSEADVQLIRDLADRAWASVGRLRAAAALAEREANQALLIEWSDAVRDETDPESVIAQTLGRLGTTFDLLNVSFSEFDPTGTMFLNVRVWQDGATFRDTRSMPISILGEDLARAFLGRASVAVEDVFRDPRISEAAHALYREYGVGALLAAPIVSQDRVVALLAMQAARPRRWSASEQQVLRDLADRVWSKVERTRSEIALTRSRKALGQAEKMASMGAVLAGISHELNNPLAIVTAQAQLIEHIAEGTELAERARRVHEAGDRCARIIQNFLAVARQTPPERQRTELSEIVERATGQVAPAINDAGIALLVRIAPALPEVLVDADQIHQLLVNLLVNAQHAVADRPAGDRRIMVEAARDGAVLHVDVVDTGPGVPEAMRERIFEPFFTTKPSGHGTGMGLALAQGLAELHGGMLTLEPGEGGARFRLTLPVAG